MCTRFPDFDFRFFHSSRQAPTIVVYPELLHLISLNMFVVGLFLLLACLSRCALASSLRCYCKSQNAIHATCDKLTPCGMPSSTGFVQCCSNGDTCGADGFCHFTQPLNGSSGYYLGGCTDPTFRDSSCPQQCSKFYQ